MTSMHHSNVTLRQFWFTLNFVRKQEGRRELLWGEARSLYEEYKRAAYKEDLGINPV